MKIALVRKTYNPFGGAERFLNQLLDFLFKKGFEVHLFANRWETQVTGSNEENRHLIFHRVPLVKGLSFLQALSFAYFSEKLLKSENFDLIHSFERIGYLDLYRAGDGCHRAWLEHRKGTQSRLKTFVTGLNPLHWSILYLERKIFLGERTLCILCNSQLVKREIQSFYGVPDGKIRVFYNGVDLQRFHPHLRKKYRGKVREEQGISEEDLVLLFLGSGFERKGLSFLLRALPLIRKNIKKPVKVLVVGKGNIVKYKKFSEKMGMMNDVVWVGPSLDPLPWYGAADLFVLPTVYDPFSNATLEALASGLPVITTRFNGAAELMEGQGCGFVLDSPLDVHQLAQGIERLSKDQTRFEFAQRARAVASRYSLEEYTKAMVSFYQDVLNRPKAKE